MGQEIERKFLLRSEAWRGLGKGEVYRQGYLSTSAERNVRVRVVGQKGILTVKSKQSDLSRLELEYEIPLADAHRLLDEVCLKPLIEKTRYKIEHGGLVWEVDEFAGENAGLVVAEVELTAEDQHVEPPPWVGEEVTRDPRYLNSSLVEHPYSSW